jgi:hypothetical protein
MHRTTSRVLQASAGYGSRLNAGHKGEAVLYPTLFKQLESARWSLEKDVPWTSFDASKITDQQLRGLKMNSIFEWSAMPTAEMFLRDNQQDSDFAAFVSIWFFEEQKHSLVLLEYLRRFAPEYLPTDEELFAVRFIFDPAPSLESLALHFCGEIRLNQWYRCAQESHTEPVIRAIYGLVAADEARHARAYFEYMKKAIDQRGRDALVAFCKIGMLMTNTRINKVMHPTNLHVNKQLFPRDTVNSRLPDPRWIENWLNNEIRFDESWEDKVVKGILKSYSSLFNVSLSTAEDLREFRNSLSSTPSSASALV